MVTYNLRALSSRNISLESGNKKLSAHKFSGRFLIPRVFSAYITLLISKSRRFLTLINAFLRLRRKRHGTGKNFHCHKFHMQQVIRVSSNLLPI